MTLNFPAKIYQILEHENPEIIRWHNHGTCFMIIDHNRFEKEIIPKYFRHNQLSSVQRQLNLYGFKCINRGEHKGAFYHSKFRQGDWEIVKKLTRYPQKQSSTRSGSATAGNNNNLPVLPPEERQLSSPQEQDMTISGNHEASLFTNNKGLANASVSIDNGIQSMINNLCATSPSPSFMLYKPSGANQASSTANNGNNNANSNTSNNNGNSNSNNNSTVLWRNTNIPMFPSIQIPNSSDANESSNDNNNMRSHYQSQQPERQTSPPPSLYPANASTASQSSSSVHPALPYHLYNNPFFQNYYYWNCHQRFNEMNNSNNSSNYLSSSNSSASSSSPRIILERQQQLQQMRQLQEQQQRTEQNSNNLRKQTTFSSTTTSHNDANNDRVLLIDPNIDFNALFNYPPASTYNDGYHHPGSVPPAAPYYHHYEDSTTYYYTQPGNHYYPHQAIREVGINTESNNSRCNSNNCTPRNASSRSNIQI